jgi:hypothetical protein
MSTKSLLIAAAAIMVLSTSSFAQQPAPGAPVTDNLSRPNQTRTARPRVQRMREFAKRDRLAGRNALNLTDEQRTQQRAIMQKHLAATRSQREQMFQLREKRLAGTLTDEDQARMRALRQEMRNSMAGARNETSSILTADQKAQIESRREKQQQRRQQMLRRRGELRSTSPSN